MKTQKEIIEALEKARIELKEMEEFPRTDYRHEEALQLMPEELET